MSPEYTALPLPGGSTHRHAGKQASSAVVIVLCVLFAAPAFAEQGMVIWKNHQCGYFILQMKSGYGIFEWKDGPQPNDEDVLEGDFSSPGERMVDNKTADLPTTILLNAFALSRSAIAARMPSTCKALPGYIPFEGP